MLAVDMKWGGTLLWHKDCRHSLGLGWGLSGRLQLGRRRQRGVGSLGTAERRVGRHCKEAAAVQAVGVGLEGCPEGCLGEGPVVVVPASR